MARYWVGGATGFLGSWLCATLSEAGHELIAVSSSGGSLPSGLEVSRCDVLDADQVERSAAGCDGAFVAVGKVSRDPKDADELYRLHVEGTKTLLSGLQRAGVSRVVYASTSGTVAVGEDPDRVYAESDPPPRSLIGRWPYYRSKLYGEQEALERSRADFEVVVVNPSLLLGPGDARESSTGDVRRFLEGEIPAVPGGGIAFVDVRDVARGMLDAMLQGRAGERYLLSGANMTLSSYLARLARLSGVASPWLRMPRGRSFALGAHHALARAMSLLGREPSLDATSVEMAQCYWYCDTAKAQRELGFEPRDPSETLRETVEDLVKRGAAFPRSSSGAAG